MKVLFVAALLLTISQVMTIDYGFADEEGWLCYSSSSYYNYTLTHEMHLVYQIEEDYRYNEIDSETLTSQAQKGLYVIGRAIVKNNNQLKCMDYVGQQEEYKLQLKKKPCRHGDCTKAIKMAIMILKSQVPKGCKVQSYRGCTYGPKC